MSGISISSNESINTDNKNINDINNKKDYYENEISKISKYEELLKEQEKIK